LKNFILLGFVCSLFFHLQLQAQNNGDTRNEKCSNREVLKEMADRLLVHYYCTTTLNPIRMEKEAGYVDDNGLPKVCNEAIRNLDEGFWMRSYLISEISSHDSSLRQEYDRRINRNNKSKRIIDFVLTYLGWPRDSDERVRLEGKLANKLRNEVLGIKVRTHQLYRQVRQVTGHIDLFLALSSLNSDLSYSCDTTSITNTELVNGACRKIIAYTPRCVEVLKLSHANQYLEIRSGLNCGTFWDIYEGYLAPGSGERSILATQVTPAARTPAPADADDDDDDEN
jgi:hypothetical protein